MAELPAYTVRARNLDTASENRIHDDAVAREYGFRGGLVPGITTYAYMTRPVVEELGRPWLERGTMTARFVAPVYDGDLVTVRARRLAPPAHHPSALAAGGAPVLVALTVEDEGGTVCATGEAELPTRPAPPPDPASYPERELPPSRPPATREHLETLGALGTVRRTFRGERAGEFLAAVADDLALYRGGAIAHPGWIVYDANQALARNVALGPWIHVETTVAHHSVVTDGEVVATRGRVASVFERKGHQFVELDLLVVAGHGDRVRPVWHVRHTAIFRIAQP